VTVVAEEAKESNVSEFPNRLASPEFFYLLQRIDGIGEKLTGEIKAVDGRVKAVEEKLTGEIKAVEEKLMSEIRASSEKSGGLFKWSIGIMIANLTMTLGVIAVVVALMIKLVH